MLVRFALEPFVALFSRYLDKQGLGCWCYVKGHGSSFMVGSHKFLATTIVFESWQAFALLAMYPHLMTFVWLYLTGQVDGKGGWMEFAKIVNRLSVKRPPVFVEKFLARYVFSQETHYDWSPEAYACFLDDPGMQYTSGRRGEEKIYTLESAQLDKLENAVDWLKPQEGERHLDSGCGWGGLIRYFVLNCGTTSHGITISRGQAEFARKRFTDPRAEFHHVTGFEAYTPSEPYDLATVVGMLEHVPVAYHPEFFRWLAGRLRKGGRVYLQCITAAAEPTDRVRLLKQHVFEHELNWINDILELARQAGFRVVSVEEDHDDYAFTTWEWVKRIRDRENEILRHLNGDQRVYRTLLGYLTLATLACAEERMHLHRVFLVKE